MASLPGGDSASVQSQRQVMVVVDESTQQDRTLCDALTHHGLTVRPTLSTNLAMEAQGWPGVIVIGNGHPTSRCWELAQRVRTFNSRVPIILYGNSHQAPTTSYPLVQANLPEGSSCDVLVAEIERWLCSIPGRSPKRYPGTILVVEDEPRLRAIVTDFLELNGFTVQAVTSGEEALEAVKAQEYRVVLLDIKMPGMDGLMTLRHLRMMHPNLPVIFMTQVDEEATIEEAVILGANDYLIKPFNFEHLKTTLLCKVF